MLWALGIKEAVSAAKGIKPRRRTGDKDRPDDLEADDPRQHPKKTGIRYATLIQNIEKVFAAPDPSAGQTLWLGAAISVCPPWC